MNCCNRMRWDLRSMLGDLVNLDPEPTSNEPINYLDLQVNDQILYLDLDKWYPDAFQIIPKKCDQENLGASDNLAKFPLSKSDAEQSRLKKFMHFDKTLGIERKPALEPNISDRQLLKLARIERSKTAGNNWYNLPLPTMTPELEQDLKIARLFHYANPKQFKKRGALSQELPKYFEVGTIVAPASDFYSDKNASSASGNPTSKSKVGFADSILKNQEARNYVKRKYLELCEVKRQAGKPVRLNPKSKVIHKHWNQKKSDRRLGPKY